MLSYLRKLKPTVDVPEPYHVSQALLTVTAMLDCLSADLDNLHIDIDGTVEHVVPSFVLPPTAQLDYNYSFQWQQEHVIDLFYPCR